jgi:hypothetical protein
LGASAAGAIAAQASSMASKGIPTRRRLGWHVNCCHHQGFPDCARHQGVLDYAHHQGFLDCVHHQVFVQLEANTYATMLWECDLEHELFKIFHHLDSELILSCSKRVLVDKNVLNIVLEQPASNLTSDGL